MSSLTSLPECTNLLEKEDDEITKKLLGGHYKKNKSESKYRNPYLGLVCVLIVVISWVAMAECLQRIPHKEHKYFNPYFQCYFVHSGYALSIIIWALIYFCYIVKKNPAKLKQQITLSIVLFSLVFSVLSYATAYLWYISIPVTTVSANTAIYQSSSVFIFILSIFMLKERVSFGKIFSVIICVGGVILVSFYGSNVSVDGVDSSVSGYVWVLASTLVYSFAETFFGRVVHTNKEADFSFNFLFLGLVGILTFLVFWPGIIILHYTGIERFDLEAIDLWPLIITQTLDLLFNGAFFVGIYCSSPLFMSVGSLLAIPVSIAVDYFINHVLLGGVALSGIFAIIVGFLGLNLTEFFAAKIGEDGRSSKCWLVCGRWMVKELWVR